MSFDTAATVPASPGKRPYRRWTAERPALNVRLRRQAHGLIEGELVASLKVVGRSGLGVRRPGNTSDERAAAIVRSALLDRLDDVLGAHAVRFAEQFRLSQVQWLDLVQAVSVALFPEEFEADGQAEIEMAELRASRQAETAREAAQNAVNEADRRGCLDLAGRMDEVARQCRRGGLVPAGGRLARVGANRLAVFADILERAAG